MAVVQISKIQVRRGKKTSNSGVPQLSSAEFAWAVDTQELYIGNGSVTEGAPYVGNTKIITEHDNILSLGNGYQFAADDPAINSVVSRSLQSKLDEYVSVKDFGAVGDGVTDDTVAFQTALNRLFRNVNVNYKKTLIIPNGIYFLDPMSPNPLAIPDGAIIRGETQNHAIINIGSANILTETATGLGATSFTSGNRPKNIQIANLTIQRTTGSLVLTGVADSILLGVKFVGTYVLGNTVSNLDTEPPAIFWNNTLAGTAVDNLKLQQCTFQGVSVAVRCLQSAVFDTRVKFEDCKFFVCNTGIYIAGVSGQGNHWQITDCDFEEIAANAFLSPYGYNTSIKRCNFKNCGTTTFNAANPTSTMISFGEAVDNNVIDCSSDRQQAAGIVSSDTIGYYSEVSSATNVNFVDRNTSLIYLSDAARPLAVFSAYSSFIVINYRLELSNFNRFGQLWISINVDRTQATITDQYQYSPLFISSTGGAMMTNFQFSVALKDNLSLSGIDTLVLYYQNPIATGNTGTISFDVGYGV